MTTEATVAVLPPGRRDLELQQVRLSPGPHEVVVHLEASGICHSQLDQIEHPARFGAPDGAPVVMGHEAIGIVIESGNAVASVRPGDRVLVTWIPRTESVTRPPGPSRVPLADGTTAVTHNVFAWGTHTVVDELFVCPAPEGTPELSGAVIGCAVMTGAGAVWNTAQVERGSTVAVWGCGGVGLPAVAAAVAAGASTVVAVDLSDEKLESARRCGATEVVNAAREDPVTRIHEFTTTSLGAGVDYVIDCIGTPDSVRAGLAAARPAHLLRHPGGAVVLVGIPTADLAVDGLDLVAKEKRLIGCRAGDTVPERDFPRIVEWHRTGLLDLSTLVTRTYRLEQINEAVADLRAGAIVGRAVLAL